MKMKAANVGGAGSTSQGMPEIVTKPPETGTEARSRLSLQFSEGTNAAHPLDVELLDGRAVREYVSIVEAAHSAVSLQQPWEEEACTATDPLPVGPLPP